MTRLLLLALTLMLVAGSGRAQMISVGPDDTQPRHLMSGRPPLKVDLTMRDAFTKDFLLDLAYNLKLWHLPTERGGLGRTVNCNGIEHQVSAIRVDGINITDGGAKGTLYDEADFRPGWNWGRG